MQRHTVVVVSAEGCVLPCRVGGRLYLTSPCLVAKYVHLYGCVCVIVCAGCPAVDREQVSRGEVRQDQEPASGGELAGGEPSHSLHVRLRFSLLPFLGLLSLLLLLLLLLSLVPAQSVGAAAPEVELRLDDGHSKRTICRRKGLPEPEQQHTKRGIM